MSLVLPGLVLLFAAQAPKAEAPSAAAVFQDLCELEGTWECAPGSGRKLTVSFKRYAGGTALVETWHMGGGRDSLTIYHLDGAALLATHYCPQGNQPRLQWLPDPSPRRSFRLRDGSNLQTPGASHAAALWIERQGKDVFLRSETYVENGSQEPGKPDPPLTFRRVGP